MTKTVLLDCDGVLLNWRDSFNRWLYDFQLVDEMDTWQLENYFFGDVLNCDPALEIPLMKMFNQTHHISSLPPIPGAVHAVKRLHEAGHILKVVTSFSGEYKSIRMREDNLIKVFGDIFQDITSLGLRGNKKEFLSLQPKDSVFIEDYIPNILCGLKVGFEPDNCFIIPHAYNSGKDYDNNKDALKGVRFVNWRYIDHELC